MAIIVVGILRILVKVLHDRFSLPRRFANAASLPPNSRIFPSKLPSEETKKRSIPYFFEYSFTEDVGLKFMIGQVLAGRYRIVQVLGAGGFGETYITADLHLPGEPECVLKHLKPATDDPAVLDIARKLFQKEAETLQQLGSFDKIPRLLAYFEERKEFYLVQELVRGHTLSRELTSGQKWPEAAVRKMLGEVLSILEFVHSQGVIHRDIKPDNIMRRDADNCLVLIDFGAIKQVRNQPTMGTAPQTVAIGTPGYMSPEQARGNPRPSSDLYALGVIGIQALSGKYPSELIEDDATGELQWQHFVQASPLMIAHLSEMTRYHFRDRFTTASAALQALKNIDSSVTLPLPPQSSPQSPPQPSVQKTAATYVVSPAQPVQQPQRHQSPPPQSRPTNPPIGNPIGKIIGAAALIGVSGFAGYSGWSMFKKSQYDQALASNQCRLATPNKGGNVTKIRFEPDRNSGIIGNLQRGEKFVALQVKEAFIEIQQPNGKRGWVFSDQIDLCFKPIATPTPTATKSPQSNKPSPPPTINPSTPPSPSPSPLSTTPTPSNSDSPSPTPSSSPSNKPLITTPSPTSIDLTPPPIALPTQNPSSSPTPTAPSASPSQSPKVQNPT
jgi:serine/threonine protein kinase, bacterial